MTSQIFKNTIPNQILIKLLDDIAIKSDNCYVLNNNSYKKGMFNDTISNFIEECKPYYHLSKGQVEVANDIMLVSQHPQ